MGAELSWRGGSWLLRRDDVWRDIAPGKRTIVTPWVICLAFSALPAGPTDHLWLFFDSVPADDLRRLRVRLALNC